MWSEIVLPLFVLAGLTCAVRLNDFDLNTAKWLYKIGDNSWRIGDDPFWKFIYNYSTIPAAIVILLSLAALGVGFWHKLFRPWQKVFLFLILSGFIGPGLITNLILKDYWHRPRPRELVEFNGWSQFQPILTYQASNEGRSFPCGHATMGFYFLAGYFLLRRHSPDAAATVGFGSICFGTVIGIARMAQGAHFFSDVLWAAAICWFVPLLLYYALRLDRSLVFTRPISISKIPLWQKLLWVSGIITVVVAVLLGTPYSSKVEYHARGDLKEEKGLRMHVVLDQGNVEITPGDSVQIQSSVNGHGMPTSRLARLFSDKSQESGRYIIYAERMIGWFHEFDNLLHIQLPGYLPQQINLKLGQATVKMQLGDATKETQINVVNGEGVLILSQQKRKIILRRKSGTEISQQEWPGEDESKPPIRITLQPEFTGTFTFEP